MMGYLKIYCFNDFLIIGFGDSTIELGGTSTLYKTAPALILQLSPILHLDITQPGPIFVLFPILEFAIVVPAPIIQFFLILEFSIMKTLAPSSTPSPIFGANT